MISGSSVLSALALHSCILLVVCLLRWITPFMKKGGGSVLLLAAALATVRLFLPLEIPVTYAYQSWLFLGPLLIFFRTHPTVTQFLLVVWGIGAVVFTVRNVAILRHAHKRCRSYPVVESEIVQKIAERRSITCPVVVSREVKVPYVAGFIHCTIYLPVLDFPEDRIELILAHEAQHVRTHDALIKLFFGFLSAVMWWNPIVHWSRHEINTLLELRCDARVTEGMDNLQRLEYAQTLKDMAKQIASDRRTPALALGESLAVGKPNVLKQRLKVIIAPISIHPQIVRNVVSCLVLALFCMSYLVVFQPANLAPVENFTNESEELYYIEDYDGLEVDDGIYNAFIVKGSDGRYQLFIDYEFSRYLTNDEAISDQYKNLYVFEETR